MFMSLAIRLLLFYCTLLHLNNLSMCSSMQTTALMLARQQMPFLLTHVFLTIPLLKCAISKWPLSDFLWGGVGRSDLTIFTLCGKYLTNYSGMMSLFKKI